MFALDKPERGSQTLPVLGQWMCCEFALTPDTFGVPADVFEKAMHDVVMLGTRSEWIDGGEREGLDNYRLSRASDAYWAWIGGFYTGTDRTDEDNAGKLADPAADGADNWSEYVANTVPTDRLDYLRLVLPAATNGVSALGFQTSVGWFYDVEDTTKLGRPYGWFGVTNKLPGNGARMSVLHSSGAAPHFYRLKAR